jgi:L-2-hydroxyglutarate oxidase
MVDKESEIALHQSGRNSGVIHSGPYYAPGSLKAKLCRDGKRELERLADEEGIPYRLCRKVVVARDESELSRLNDLKARGRREWCRRAPGDRPRSAGRARASRDAVRALHAPRTGVIDHCRVALAYAARIERANGEILLGQRVPVRTVSAGLVWPLAAAGPASSISP